MTTLGLYVGWSDVSCGIIFNFLQDKFKGEFLHSTEHKRALDHAGKKVVIVGSCTSGERTQPPYFTSMLLRLLLAHDIAKDYYDHGVGKLSLAVLEVC